MPRLLLLRHGRTEWNATRRFQGQLDPPLDDVGRAQAATAATAVAALGPTVVVSSDLSRAVETAAELGAAADLSVAVDARLREIDLGDWQGLTGEQARSAYPSEWEAWRAGSDERRGGGETYAEVAERATACVAAFLPAVADDPDGLLVLVTHGGTSRALIGSLLALGPADWWRFGPLANCHWSTLVDSGRGWRLEEHNAGLVEPSLLPDDPGAGPAVTSGEPAGDDR